MLVLRVWPSRPTFDSSFSDFDQMRREMDGEASAPCRDGIGGDTSPPI